MFTHTYRRKRQKKVPYAIRENTAWFFLQIITAVYIPKIVSQRDSYPIASLRIRQAKPGYHRRCHHLRRRPRRHHSRSRSRRFGIHLARNLTLTHLRPGSRPATLVVLFGIGTLAVTMSIVVLTLLLLFWPRDRLKYCIPHRDYGVNVLSTAAVRLAPN